MEMHVCFRPNFSDGTESYGDNVVQLPGSKSIAARLLMIESFCDNPAVYRNFSTCDDAWNLRRALAQCREGGFVDVGESGTALRFVLARAAMNPGVTCIIRGSKRLMERPIEPLARVLQLLGASVAITPDGIEVTGAELTGGEVEIDGDVSSQFISALLLIAPYMPEGLVLNVYKKTVSTPYIDLTCRIMEQHGIRIDGSIINRRNKLKVYPGNYQMASQVNIEADWSAASYFYEFMGISYFGHLELSGLHEASFQPDKGCVNMFGSLDVDTYFTSSGNATLIKGKVLEWEKSDDPEYLFLDDNPDLVPALAVAYAMRGIPFYFDGIRSLHFKESDRIEALIKELRKLGIVAEGGDDYLAWDGGICPILEPITIDSHGDHRIAMAFAVAAVSLGRIVTIRDAEVVTKSFPGFFAQLQKIGFSVSRNREELEKIMSAI